MNRIIAALCLPALGFLSACSEVQSMLGRPSGSSSKPLADIPAQNRLDATPLVEVRLRIPPPPIPPRDPSVEQVDAAEFARRPAQFHGTEHPAFSSSQPARVAVMGSINLVGADSSAGKFVGDMVFATLQRRGVSLVDRDYRGVKKEEMSSIQQGRDGARPTGLIELTPSEEAALTSEDKTADYMVMIHSLVIPNNPVLITVPWRVKPDEWQRYEAARTTYLAEVQAYNEAIAAYEKEVNDYVDRLAKNRSLQPIGNSDAHDGDAWTPERLKDWVEKQPSVRDRRSESAMTETGMEPSGIDPATVPPELRAQSLGWVMQQQKLYSRSDRPHRIETREARLYSSPEEVVTALNNAPHLQVAAFQAGVSVRVINMKTFKAEWFGFASAQDLDYAQATNAACESIAGHLVAYLPAADANGQHSALPEK